MVVGSRLPDLCQELQRYWGFHLQQSSQLDTTMANIGVNIGRHPCGMLSTPCSPCPDEFEAFLMAKGGATQYYDVPKGLYTQCV
jgi:hypothetical protein